MGTPGAGHGHKVIGYDFANYDGVWPTGVQTTIASAASGATAYPFRSFGTGSGSFRWDYHLSGCHICPGTVLRPAHGTSGYYLHKQFCSVVGQLDPYLDDNPPANPGGQNQNISPNAEIGPPSGPDPAFYYPTNVTGVDLSSVLTSDYLFGRFWFRPTDEWANQERIGGGTLEFCKFVRLGTTVQGDNYGPIIFLTQGSRTEGSPPQYTEEDGWLMGIWYDGAGTQEGHRAPLGIEFDDGEWHSICWLWHTLAHNGTTDPNGEISFWVDNWNLDPIAYRRVLDKRQCHFTGISPSAYRMALVYLCNNWSSNYPSTLMGIDFGGPIEIWDGEPTTEELQGVAALQNDGKKYYYRFRYKDASGRISGWSNGADYFMMAHAPTGSVLLPSPTASGTVILGKIASGSVTLPSVTASGTATKLGAVTCTGSVALPSVTASGTAIVGRLASGAIALPSITAIGLGERLVKATGSVALPSPVVSGGAVHYTAGAIIGSVALPGVTASGTAIVGRLCVGGLTLPVVTASGVAKAGRLAAGSVTLPTIRAIGAARRGSRCLGSVRLPGITVGITSKVGRLCSGFVTLPGISAYASMGEEIFNRQQHVVAWHLWHHKGFGR